MKREALGSGGWPGNMARYLIGIDLGTTNCALAYVDLTARGQRRVGTAELHAFAVPQLVAPGDVRHRPLLPSFLYLPGPHDLPAGATALPWDPACDYAAGEFARNQGVRVPGRLVTSAKSWLCHAGVDRSAPLLPWSAPADVARISPVEASARYLRHLTEAWNHEMARGRPDDRLENQEVVLTVPASFDDVARNLTVDAARKAGMEHLTLLEEPQAAFYCWLASQPADEAAKIRPGARCLVLDVGGGTSDFSLIQAVEQDGELGFVRQAVGDHLLLGGDNMDLALAKFVEARLPAAGRLDAAQYGQLTQSCRLAKEVLLGDSPPPAFTVAVVGRGRQVVGGTQRVSLIADDVRQVIFEGFFPVVLADAVPQRGARTGLHEMGLPYVSDPAVSRHLAQFLQRHARQGGDGNPEGAVAAPEAVLFNGGVFQPPALRARLLEVLRQWFDVPGHPWQPLVLSNPSLDLAVAWGAAHYAWLRHTGGRRIGGGIARSYYIAVSAADTGSAAPAAGQTTVLCVVPQRLEEGQEIALERPELELSLGQPVMFPLYTSTVRCDDHAGDVLSVRPEQLRQMPPLHTVLRGGKRSGTRQVPVTLAARCTEVGTLELWCVAREGGGRWRLEFNVRDILKEEEASLEDGDGRAGVMDIWPEAQVQAAARLIEGCYGDDIQPEPRELTRALESALEAPRYAWPTGLCRRLWESLGTVAEQRRRSPAHLARWYNLVGYSLRPGFGDPLDRYRVDQLWKLIHAPPKAEAGKTSSRLPEGGADYWIMWRRVAGGLNTPLQASLFNRLRPALLPSKGRVLPRPVANELAEMWRAAASLERLDAKQKELLGAMVLRFLRRSPMPTYGFWSLTRLGARVLFYGPLNAVVHREVVGGWLDAVIGFQPAHQSERVAWGFCLTQLARRSGQRALDVDEGQREAVLTALRAHGAPPHWVRMVEEVSELESDEQSQLFGESLPIGLRLARAEE